MVYPSLPYPGYRWSMNQHMGVINSVTLYQLLWAANAFRQNADPAYDINNYLNTNNILTANVRVDSGQPDGWRDYQQVLSELGLIISTRIHREITLTPIGQAYLEETLSYSEMMTLQALRYQFPNGHKTTISPTLRSQLSGTQFSNVSTVTELQIQTGVRVRPAVLVWKVLRELAQRNEIPSLTNVEVETFLVPCTSHNDLSLLVRAIISSRQRNERLQGASRQTQEWMRFLLMTPLFHRPRQGVITISAFGNSAAPDIDAICDRLEEHETFWMPSSSSDISLINWYMAYGGIDISVNLIDTAELDEESPTEGNAEKDEPLSEISSINLRRFSSDNLIGNEPPEASNSRQDVVYDRQSSVRQHILHDHMVAMIAHVSVANGGEVFDDPQSLDLLIKFKAHEFLVEVKSVNPRTFVNRLRLALGQLLHYEYLRSQQSQVPRRKVVAFPALLRPTNWAIPFIRDFMDYDLLTLTDNIIQVESSFPMSRELFQSTNR